jgi:hypothetical protein
MPDFLRGFERGLQKNVVDALRLVPRNIRAAARSGLDRRAGIVSSAKPLMGRNLATGIAATGTAGVTLANLASRAAALPALVVAGKEVFNPKDNIITALQNLGTSVENQFAVPGQERRYVGSDPRAVAMNRVLDARAGLRTGLRDFGPGYRESELRAGAAAEAFRPGAGFPGQQVGSPAAERDYQQKVSRVAQLTAQDPELQRYEEARKKAKLAGPGSAAEQSAEDLGMQMWAKANPTLAKQVTPGQSGFDAIYKQVGRMPATSFNPLMDRTFGYQTGGGPVTGGQETLGPIPLIPQVDQSLNPASPTFIGGEGPPLMDFSRDNLTPEMIEKYQRQLLQQAKPK